MMEVWRETIDGEHEHIGCCADIPGAKADTIVSVEVPMMHGYPFKRAYAFRYEGVVIREAEMSQEGVRMLRRPLVVVLQPWQDENNLPGWTSNFMRGLFRVAPDVATVAPQA